MEKDELLDKYVEGTLSPEEQAYVDDLLRSDQAFAEEFAFQDKVRRAIAANKRRELKDKLVALETKAKKGRHVNPWLYAAASVVVLIGLTVWVQWNTVSIDRLYTKYYDTYPNVVSPIVRGDQGDALKYEAFFAYERGEYEKAAKLFSSLVQEDEGADYALLYEGISLMELDRHQEAIELFLKYPDDGKYVHEVNWYAALSYLKLGKKDDALPLLRDLTNVAHPIGREAKGLLQELE